MEEKSLIIENCLRGILNGDTQAVDKICQLMGNDLFFLAKSFDLDDFDANDVVQDTYVKIVERAGTYTKSVNPVGWINTIVRNCAIDLIRKKKRHPEASYESVMYYYGINDDYGEVVYDVLDKLSPKEAKLARMRFLSKYTLKEIAECQHKNIGVVNYHLKKIEAKLRKIYDKMQD